MSYVDPLDTRTQEQDEEARKEKLRIAQRQEADDLKWLMSHPQGRRFMWSLIGLTGVYQSSFTGNSETFFREGQRNVGLKLVHQIHTHCPDKYATMTKEMNDDNA